MSESASSTPGSLRSVWVRYGALIVVIGSAGHFIGDLYLENTYAKKTTVEDAVNLVYTRTGSTNARVNALDNKLAGIAAKLDDASEMQDERARRAESDTTEIKNDLREIRSVLLTPRATADVRTGR